MARLPIAPHPAENSARLSPSLSPNAFLSARSMSAARRLMGWALLAMTLSCVFALSAAPLAKQSFRAKKAIPQAWIELSEKSWEKIQSAARGAGAQILLDVANVRGRRLAATTRRQWEWGVSEGYFQADVRPQIGATDYRGAWGEGDGLEAKDQQTIDGRGEVVARGCQVNATAAFDNGLRVSSKNAERDAQISSLHELSHCEFLTHMGQIQFNGALAQGDAGLAWKALVWAQTIARRPSRGAAPWPLPGEEETLDALAEPKASTMARNNNESLADSLMAISRAKQTPDAQSWRQDMLALIATRAESSLLFDNWVDPHETQESLMILASIGWERLRALNGEQARRLADAVAADGAILAAADDGALAASQKLLLGPVAKMGAWSASGGENPALRKFALEKLRPSLAPAARAWAALPRAKREALVRQLAQTAQAAWWRGASLDYGFIAPGLRATFPAQPLTPYASWDEAIGENGAIRLSMDDAELSERAVLIFRQLGQGARALGETDAAALARAPAFDFLMELASLRPNALNELKKDAFARQAIAARRRDQRQAARPEGLAGAGDAAADPPRLAGEKPGNYFWLNRRGK